MYIYKIHCHRKRKTNHNNKNTSSLPYKRELLMSRIFRKIYVYVLGKLKISQICILVRNLVFIFYSGVEYVAEWICFASFFSSLQIDRSFFFNPQLNFKDFLYESCRLLVTHVFSRLLGYKLFFYLFILYRPFVYNHLFCLSLECRSGYTTSVVDTSLWPC